MSLLQASNFKVTVRPERPAVSVLFKPTRRRYIYTANADRTRNHPPWSRGMNRVSSAVGSKVFTTSLLPSSIRLAAVKPEPAT
jgi:hypothetical protein